MRTEALRSAVVAATFLLLTTTAALPAPATAASGKASKRCPTAGRTLAAERYGKTVTSRVWRIDGRTYGCTLVASQRPRTRLLTRARTGLLRLRNDTVAWTTSHVAAGVPASRVWMYDLTNGRRLLRSARAIPRQSPSDVPREGTVEQLRVEGGFFVAWVADGDTVVVGAHDPGTLALTGPDAGAPPYLDGDLAIAGRYEARPELSSQLSGSLQVAALPGDHGDSDDCAYSYAVAYRWSTGPATAFEAVMRGTRITPQTCG